MLRPVIGHVRHQLPQLPAVHLPLPIRALKRTSQPLIRKRLDEPAQLLVRAFVRLLQPLPRAGLRRLRDRLPLALVLVGAGPLEAALRDESRRTGVPVEFPGVVDQRDLPAAYAAADAFVLASFTEGHPKVLLEAMAAGVPCVASDCAGNRSLVADGATGLLFDARRPEALAACLERVLTDETLAASVAKAARDLVVARYDLAALVAREIALLRTVARGGAPAER